MTQKKTTDKTVSEPPKGAAIAKEHLAPETKDTVQVWSKLHGPFGFETIIQNDAGGRLVRFTLVPGDNTVDRDKWEMAKKTKPFIYRLDNGLLGEGRCPKNSLAEIMAGEPAPRSFMRHLTSKSADIIVPPKTELITNREEIYR